MNEVAENPYKAPSAELASGQTSDDIQAFGRFTAWGVFGLSIITFGLYPIYWLCSRAGIANSLHEQEIHRAWLALLVVSTGLSFASGFFGESEVAVMAALAITLAYMVSYLVVLFSLRNRLQDVMNRGSGNSYSLNPILTFFLSAIYLQYKINQCIDEGSHRAR